MGYSLVEVLEENRFVEVGLVHAFLRDRSSNFAIVQDIDGQLERRG
jgi:hypothetical protein